MIGVELSTEIGDSDGWFNGQVKKKLFACKKNCFLFLSSILIGKNKIENFLAEAKMNFLICFCFSKKDHAGKTP